MKTWRIAVPLLLLAAVAVAMDIQPGYKPASGTPAMGIDSDRRAQFMRVNDAGMPVGYRLLMANTIHMAASVAGTIGYKLTAECYRCMASSETVYLCDSLTCTDAGGVPFPPNAIQMLCSYKSATGGADGGAQQDYAPRSASGTGLMDCTEVQ